MRGWSSRREDLPHVLRLQLPVSISAAKQEFQANLDTRFSLIDPNFPFTKFHKKLFGLSTKQASLIMQLRTGHFPLNYYLKHIEKVDSNKCMKCAENPDQLQVRETINHFLLECRTHEEARNTLVGKIGKVSFLFVKS